jgi:serine/threonine protein kinase
MITHRRSRGNMVGERFGPYSIELLLGAGGMGEVYRARDTRLDRTVAIKLLPPGLSTPTRSQRFAREARAVSKVNHPHICTLYDIGEQDGMPFIVMEHLEGETLAQRIRRGALPLDQVLRVAIEIADALAHAHRQGVVHRDLKPANIMLTPAGAKLLDFGIAALHAPAAQGTPMVPLPAGAETLTEEGTIVGTLQYMAPEQLEARATDARADIFAFGAIVYEMATGQQAFQGGSRASIIAAVLERDPQLLLPARAETDGSSAPTQGARPTMPWLLNQIVARCLAKNPDDRFQSAADLGQALRWMARSGSSTALPAAPRSAVGWLRYRAAWIMAGVILVVVAAALIALKTFRNAESAASNLPTGRSVRFVVTPPPNAAFSPSSASFALSPDGRTLAFTGTVAQSDLAVWLQPLDSLEAKRLPGTEGAGQLFWSPDSHTIAFADTTAEFKPKRVDLSSGVVRSLAAVQISGVAAWSAEHGIIGNHGGIIQRVPLDGGPPTPVTRLDETAGEIMHLFPAFIPNGRSFIFLGRSTNPEHDNVAYMSTLGSFERVRLFNSDSQVVYAAPGYLIYMLGNTLLARAFDAERLQVTGQPVPIAEQVERNTGSRRGGFTVSQTGVLAYRQHTETQLVWFDRGGRRLQTLGPTGHYRNPALSPDEKRVAVAGFDSKTGTWDIWLMEVGRGGVSRFTTHPALDDMPIWSPDGSRIAFKSERNGEMAFYHKSSSGTGEEELIYRAGSYSQALHAWHDDTLLYGMGVFGGSKTIARTELRMISIAGDGKSAPIIQNRFWNPFCALSADGRWLAYTSDEAGRFDVYGMPFPSGHGKWPISVAGGTEPAWRADGKELFYLAPDRYLMAVPIKAGSSLQSGTPQRLFEAPVSSNISSSYTRNQYVVTGDGQRFLINQPVGRSSFSALTVVVDWTAALRNRSGF